MVESFCLETHMRCARSMHLLLLTIPINVLGLSCNICKASISIARKMLLRLPYSSAPKVFKPQKFVKAQ